MKSIEGVLGGGTQPDGDPGVMLRCEVTSATSSPPGTLQLHSGTSAALKQEQKAGSCGCVPQTLMS